MVEGTRQAQLAEAVTNLREETASLKEEQGRQRALMENVLQQLSSLAVSYDNLAQLSSKTQQGEGSSGGDTMKVIPNPAFVEHGGIQARTLRLEFPRFDGSEPTEWILKTQQYFAYFQTLDHQKLQIASFHMEGKALSWYSWLMESCPVTTWDEFLIALKVRFGPSAYEDPVGAFTKLRQTHSVEEYQTKFEILSNKITGLNEEFRISTFLSGLRDDLRVVVAMFKPTTLSAAFGLARLQEEEVWRRNQSDHNPTPHITTYTPSTKTTTPPPPNHNSILKLPAPPPPRHVQNSSYQPQEPPYPIKRITSSQMQERRDKGLCYFCDEKYRPGHKCNRPKIYLLEGMDEVQKTEVGKDDVMATLQAEIDLDEFRKKFPNLEDKVF